MSRNKQIRNGSLAEGLQRELAHEEVQHDRRTRTLIGVGVLVAVGLLLLGVGVAMMLRKAPRAATTALAPTASAPQEHKVVTAAPEQPAAAPSSAKKIAADKSAAIAAKPVKAPRSVKPAAKPAAQHFGIAIGAKGYEPSQIVAKAGAPISLTVARGEGCAAGFKMPSLHVSGDNSSGPTTLSLGVLKPGTYAYTCSMGMVSGRLIVR